LSVYKGKAFVRFAKNARITDAELWKAAQRANEGLIDADLGGGVIKQRIARIGEGGLADHARSSFSGKATALFTCTGSKEGFSQHRSSGA